MVTKVAIGAFVLFGVATAVLNNRAPISVSIFVAVIVLVLGVVATIVSAVAGASGRKAALLGQVIAWGIVGGFLAASALVLSSAFFGLPVQGALLVARLLSAPELIHPDPSATSR